jgi:hypothetical protein
MPRRIYYEGDPYIARKVTPEELQEAIDAGKKRRDLHKGYGSTKHWIDPREGPYSNEIWGCLGEIVFRTALKRNNIEDITKYPSLCVDKTEELSSLPDWDYLIEDKEIEAKAIPPEEYKKRLLVKVCEYKPMDFFVGIKFLSKEEYFFAGWCTDEELREHPVQNFGFTNSYWRFLTELHPMTKEWWKQ